MNCVLSLFLGFVGEGEGADVPHRQAQTEEGQQSLVRARAKDMNTPLCFSAADPKEPLSESVDKAVDRLAP